MGLHSGTLPSLQALAHKLGGEVSGGQVLAPGPGHGADDRSLAVKPDGNGGFIVHSFSGDDVIECKDHVRRKAGLEPFKPGNGNGAGHHRASDGAVERALMAAVAAQGRGDKPTGKLGTVVATYDYTDRDGKLLYQVLRLEPKSFRQRRPDGNGGHAWNLDDVRRVPYRLQDLLQYPDGTVFVCEGEKDADRIASLGHCGTTAASGKWTPECVQALAGRHIVILQDNDVPGAKRALEAAQQLHGAAASVRVVQLPDLPDKGDVSDWLDADPRNAEKLVEVCFDVPEWEPSSTPPSENVIQSSGQFTRNYSPPDYLVDGLLQRRYCYSFTARTGVGKTALALLFAGHVGLGLPLGEHEVDKGRVLIFAGENPNDVQARWIAMGQQMNYGKMSIVMGASSTPPSENVVQSSGQFTRNYSPPDYLVDGFLQRRYCYSFTARTGAGETALALLLAAHVGLGLPLGDREVDKGRVLIFAGENPNDVQARWIAMAQQMDFDLETIDVHFVPGRFKISELIERIRKEMEALGGAALLIIDTTAAYFEGDDENDNVQLGAHASRMRELRIPGGPCTIINCHPTKNAADDNLIPRGGGAFLNEVDGNLAARKDDMAVELHWQGKFRGPEFAPMNFMLKSVTHERLKDSKGRLISTVVASYLTDQAQQEMAKVARSDEDLLLEAVGKDDGASISDLAILLDWRTSKGDAYKSKVHRVLARLKKYKLIVEERGKYTVSDKGKKVLEGTQKRSN